ncbi:TrkH family potassium uptake protein [Acidaminobacterium chupaoyuni]
MQRLELTQKVKNYRKNLPPVRVIVIGFALVILIGTALLMLPFATRSGESAGFITSLFTATSATCVTGLIVEDTYLFWSPFGQVVIILLIQTGGLGFMTLATAFSLLLRRKISMRERLLISSSLNLSDMSGMVRMVRQILYGTLLFEGMGALILSVRFARDYGIWGGITRGIFHAISAFCNAGFDILGDRGAFSSLGSYRGDFVVTITIALLIVIGGLGFFVWSDIYASSEKGRLHTHTKIVLRTTAILLVLGTLSFFVAEYHNPGTFGDQNVFGKLLSAFFQSVTTRTAGYAQVDQAALTNVSKAVSVGLMFIGGSPGSTAGGIKTVTFAVLITSALSALKGTYQPIINGRSLQYRSVIDALSVFVVGLTAVSIGTFLVAAIDHVALSSALFECVSAFGTVGLTLGLTPNLSAPSLLILVSLMYIGRVGIITLGVAAMMRGHAAEPKIQFPPARVMIG